MLYSQWSWVENCVHAIRPTMMIHVNCPITRDGRHEESYAGWDGMELRTHSICSLIITNNATIL